MKSFDRKVSIQNSLERNKVLIIYGARQVGKTTLVKKFLKLTSLKYAYFTGDQLDFAQDLAKCDLEIIKQITTGLELLVIDEAQLIPNIGRALKLIVDNIPDIFVIVTGSSSFELANYTSESLTGRKNILNLYTISAEEILNIYTPYEINKKLEELLIYGQYPEILTYSSNEDKQKRITEVRDSYLIKDILTFHRVKSSNILIRMLKLLAFQIGSEVSTSEIGNKLEIDNKTVARYLDLLEKSFVLYRLDGFSRNMRKEVSKMSKYYFYDLGIRNAMISNFNKFEDRNDVGNLWENFLMIERLKRWKYNRGSVNLYFWRTYDQKQIDLIEERDGKLCAYEFKYSDKKQPPAPKDWINNYPNSTFEVVNPSNWLNFVT